MTETLHGLRVLAPTRAKLEGFESITHAIHTEYEDFILAGVSQGRNPERTAWIKTGKKAYQLAMLREDIAEE